MILGVTNPFFAKTLQHWPHIVRLGDTLDIKKVKLRKAGNLKTLDSKPGKMTPMVFEILWVCGLDHGFSAQSMC